MTEAQAEEKNEQETARLIQLFQEHLGVDEEVGEILAREGFSTIEEVAYVPASEMLEIEEFDEEIVTELRERAKDALLTMAISKEESYLGAAEPGEELLAMEGMDEELAAKLAGRGITTLEELAEQGVDDLLEIEGLDRERAAQLIMKAREPWFAEQAQE